MATQEDRSLAGGAFFPRWMKNKMSDKFDLDQSTLSPTEIDDSFMYYYRNSSKTKITETVKSTSAQVIKACNSAVTKSDFSKIPPQQKPKGTDDGFKGETAQVGTSVVRVANQIVSGKPIQGSAPEPAEECEQLLAKFDPYRRRGSRSLPTSPLTSPKAKRRMNQYFTGPYVETDKSKGWILSSLLAKRQISQSMGFIGEDKKEEMEKASSVQSLEDTSKVKTQVYKAKPSELREMNFWSPTSM